MERRLLVMDQKDNVGVVLERAEKQDTCKDKGRVIKFLGDIEFAHKVALIDIPKDQPVVKYGQEIGHAENDIHQGEWVHIHNMTCARGK